MDKAIRVLLVDDYLDFREWICSKLKTNCRFFIAGEAANGQEAIQKARDLIPDLILLDLNLPDTNGLDVQQELRKKAPFARVLFVSGCRDEDVVRCALSNGAGGYVLKANADQELVPAMESVILGERFVSSGLMVTRNATQPLVYELAVT